MFYQLPPVGRPVSLDGNAAINLPPFLASCQTQFYNSGTAALAAAISAAVVATHQSKRVDIAEVLMPAYACPDLISAAIYAGVKPVLVDLEAGRPWMDLALLSASITQNTVAIIAVNLFGIAERWPQLRELAMAEELILIEDSAQYFPAENDQQNWQGDLSVLSFGRGKPVSLLGGGAVIGNNPTISDCMSELQLRTVNTTEQVKFRLKASLYNAMISPRLYWLPQSLPFLHLGETRYHALDEIKPMDKLRFSFLATNIRCYQDDILAEQRSLMLSTMLTKHEAVVNLPAVCGVTPNHRLLRYPVLLDVSIRDKVYQNLKQAGLGASLMYPDSLPNITGLKHILDVKQRYPNAEAFASRLITLPTHSQINDFKTDKIDAILNSMKL